MLLELAIVPPPSIAPLRNTFNTAFFEASPKLMKLLVRSKGGHLHAWAP